MEGSKSRDFMLEAPHPSTPKLRPDFELFQSNFLVLNNYLQGRLINPLPGPGGHRLARPQVLRMSRRGWSIT